MTAPGRIRIAVAEPATGPTDGVRDLAAQAGATTPLGAARLVVA